MAWKIIILILFSSTVTCFSAGFKETMVLDGSEKIVKYGIDTSGNWWAITELLANSKKLYVNGKVSDVFLNFEKIQFSYDGNRWGCFAIDNSRMTNLLTEDTTLYLRALRGADILFSPDSKSLFFTYTDDQRTLRTCKIDDLGKITCGSRKDVEFPNKRMMFISPNSDKTANIVRKGKRTYVQVGRMISSEFDDIKEIGFWNDGSFLYAAKSGDRWEIYRDLNLISEPFLAITDTKINKEGTLAGVVVKRTQKEYVALTITDKYTEPLVSKPYDMITGLILNPNPNIPMISFIGKKDGQNFVVMSNTEYFGGSNPGKPSFTYDGSDLYFVGCDIDCFVNINGKKFNLNTEITPTDTFAMKPGSNTIAYSTSSAMVIRFLARNEMSAGKMMDDLAPPIYNWKKNQYETLGRIGQRLYHIVFKF